MRRFLGVLLDNNRASLFPAVSIAFHAELDRQRGVSRARLESARPLAAEQVDRLAARLATRLGREVVLETRVRPELLGGVVIEVDSEEIDGSVQGKLQQMGASLLQRAAGLAASP
jgi:F-type H+-transporting ATPase subunit delta